MAITQTSQVLYDGPRRAKLQFTGVSDGSGQLSLATLVDATALGNLGSPAQLCKSVKVERITGNVKPTGSVELYWGALTPVKFAEITGYDPVFDYSNITGITVPPGTPGPSGDILISTTGFVAGTTYMIELELIKKASL